MRANHPIFQGPLPVEITFDKEPVWNPEADPRGTWLIQKGKLGPENDYGVVSDGVGFEDSPDCEIISGGINSKGPHGLAIGRQANLLQWGFYCAPDRMTDSARHAFLNAIVYMKRFDGRRAREPGLFRRGLALRERGQLGQHRAHAVGDRAADPGHHDVLLVVREQHPDGRRHVLGGGEPGLHGGVAHAPVLGAEPLLQSHLRQRLVPEGGDLERERAREGVALVEHLPGDRRTGPPSFRARPTGQIAFPMAPMRYLVG